MIRSFLIRFRGGFFPVVSLALFHIVFQAPSVASASTTVFTSSNLPIVILDTEEAQIPDSPKITVRMRIIDNGRGSRNSVEDPAAGYDGWIGIEARGNSSQYIFPKKSYLLETRDSQGGNLNVPILGMPEDNDWILLAGYMDKTLVRNPLAHHMSTAAGRYACRSSFVELVLNGEYEGIYLFMETIKPGKNRVPVVEMDSTDITWDGVTGGYIYEVSQGSETFGERRCFKYPKASDIRPEQTEYIRYYDDGFRNRMRQSGFARGYSAWIDVDSFIDEILVQEACKNSDAYGWSSFFFKDRLGKLNAGPVWDFDQALSNSTFSEGNIVEEWQIEKGYWEVPFFWKKLFHETEFRRRLSNRWFFLRSGPFQTDSLMSRIDSWAAFLMEARARNFSRWPILGKELWRSLPGWEERDTYIGEVDYMKRFLADHLDWMDSELRSTADAESPSGPRGKPALRIDASPNPFRSGTVIRLTGPSSVPKELVVYDMLGRTVASLKPCADPSGTAAFRWDGRDGLGRPAAAGMYILRFAGADDRSAAMRLVKY